MAEKLGLINRLSKSWDAFMNKEPDNINLGPSTVTYGGGGMVYRSRSPRGNERSIVTTIYNKIAVDVSQIDFKHVKMDSNGRYEEDIDSYTNQCLTLSANEDQTARMFIEDLVSVMLNNGCAITVPTRTYSKDSKLADPRFTDSYELMEIRVGKPVEWYPHHIKVEVYNPEAGKREEIVLPKRMLGVHENPFYAKMNEPNSTLQRLIRKLNILDDIDEQTGSGKLDLIIQLPYSIRSEKQKQAAEMRRENITEQLSNSKYGIAYVDATEHVTQLNRSLENNLLKQIEYLTSMLYSQLGMSKELMDGTATEQQLLNYENSIVSVICNNIVDEFKRKFISKTARTQGQSFMYFRNPFKLIPLSQLAELSDKLTRNEIVSSNEIRTSGIGLKPSKDPSADELRNKNLNQSNNEVQGDSYGQNVQMDQEQISEIGRRYING